MSSNYVTNERFDKLDDRVTVLETDMKSVKVQVDNHAQAIGALESLNDFVSPSLIQFAKANPGFVTAEKVINLGALADKSPEVIEAAEEHIKAIKSPAIKKEDVVTATTTREADENKLIGYTPTCQDDEIKEISEELVKNAKNDVKSAFAKPTPIRTWFIKHYNPGAGGTNPDGTPISFCNCIAKQDKVLYIILKSIDGWRPPASTNTQKDKDHNTGLVFDYLKKVASARTSENAKYTKHYDLIEKAYEAYKASLE
jgi:hypothetical protein